MTRADYRARNELISLLQPRGVAIPAGGDVAEWSKALPC